MTRATAAAVLAFAAGCGIAAAQDVVCFEAEWAETLEAPMQRAVASTQPVTATWRHVDGASGESYLEIPQGKGNPPDLDAGKATYTFETPADGTYIMWCRVWWDNECGNSFAVSIDGAKPFTFGQDGTYDCWHWVKSPRRLKQLTLKKGPHTLSIHNREDGIRLDQILFTSDSSFVPVDRETVTVKKPEPPPAAKQDTP